VLSRCGVSNYGCLSVCVCLYFCLCPWVMLPTNSAQAFALAGTVFVYLGGMADLCCSSVAAGWHTCFVRCCSIGVEKHWVPAASFYVLQWWAHLCCSMFLLLTSRSTGSICLMLRIARAQSTNDSSSFGTRSENGDLLQTKPTFIETYIKRDLHPSRSSFIERRLGQSQFSNVWMCLEVRGC
jgi:hypothetical protein